MMPANYISVPRCQHITAAMPSCSCHRITLSCNNRGKAFEKAFKLPSPGSFQRVSAESDSSDAGRRVFLYPETSEPFQVDAMSLIATAEHTTKAFDADLQSLNRMIAKMGGHAERQLTLAVNA